MLDIFELKINENGLNLEMYPKRPKMGNKQTVLCFGPGRKLSQKILEECSDIPATSKTVAFASKSKKRSCSLLCAR